MRMRRVRRRMGVQTGQPGRAGQPSPGLCAPPHSTAGCHAVAEKTWIRFSTVFVVVKNSV